MTLLSVIADIFPQSVAPWINATSSVWKTLGYFHSGDEYFPLGSLEYIPAPVPKLVFDPSLFIWIFSENGVEFVKDKVGESSYQSASVA